jgi:SAM-dependent methyltransferase
LSVHGHERCADRFGCLTDRAIDPLLDAARVGKGTRLVDVACGPGNLTRAAAARGAHAVGTDLAPAMIALARRLHPGLEFYECSAETTPFAPDSFDAAVCAFGMGHFPEAERVALEIRRILASGGIAAFSWWEGFARNRINGIFHETLARLGVSALGVLPQGPPIDRFSDADRFAEFLRAAGFTNIRVDSIAFSHRLRDADALWELAMGSFARASATIRAQSAEMRKNIRHAVTDAVRLYAVPGGLDIPVAFLVAAGTKP